MLVIPPPSFGQFDAIFFLIDMLGYLAQHVTSLPYYVFEPCKWSPKEKSHPIFKMSSSEYHSGQICSNFIDSLKKLSHCLRILCDEMAIDHLQIHSIHNMLHKLTLYKQPLLFMGLGFVRAKLDGLVITCDGFKLCLIHPNLMSLPQDNWDFILMQRSHEYIDMYIHIYR